MSYLGFKASNHPQQIGKRGALDSIDDRRTPVELVEWAAQIVGGTFDLDVAASAENTKADRYLTVGDNGLDQPWMGRVWCNPPYSDCATWVRKAWLEYDSGRADAIAMLLPANRTEQAWWQDLVEWRRDQPGSPLRTAFIRGRIRFGHPDDWPTPAKGDRPPFGLVLLTWAGGR